MTDTREQAPLVFPKVIGIEYVTETLPVGDYTSWHKGVPDTSVVERKSVADCFTAFTSNYPAERNKILRAKDLHLQYILAIESSFTELLKGHAYWKDGALHESRKSGMAMVRQLSMMTRKYGIVLWYCTSRHEMAMRITEHFLAGDRLLEQQGKESKDD